MDPTLTILGCTLWSALNPGDLDILSWALSDFRRIDNFKPSTYMSLHEGDVGWLIQSIKVIRESEPHRRIVIFTHHAPTIDGTGDPKYVGGPTNSAFATELTGEPWWGLPMVSWAFGHTHWNCDFERNGVRVVSNQRGYGEGGTRFDESKVLVV